MDGQDLPVGESGSNHDDLGALMGPRLKYWLRYGWIAVVALTLIGIFYGLYWVAHRDDVSVATHLRGPGSGLIETHDKKKCSCLHGNIHTIPSGRRLLTDPAAYIWR